MPTDSCGPRSASTAAFCEIEHGFDVEWLCNFVIACTTAGGTRPNPIRYPVMEYVLESEPATSTVSLAPGSDAMENGSLS